MNAVLFSCASFVSTFAGGLFALKFRDRLHLILSFTAGVMLGVVSFDLLPEIFATSREEDIDPIGAMVSLVVGFLLFHAVEKFVLLHRVHEASYADHHHPHVGVLSGLSLAGHSFMDGVGIGLGFQVSPSAGILIAIAVIAHDFCDGLNTMSLMLLHHNRKSPALAMLTLDALAPILGAVSTLFFHLPSSFLVLYLGFFAGFLLYIGASDILPEAHSQNRSGTAAALIALTCLGAAFIFVAVRLAK